MQKVQAQNIVSETLQNDFNREKFLYFIKNLLNRVDESKAFHARGYIPEAYKKYIRTYERLATYTDPEGKKLDILVVYLQKESSLERARTAQRNFVARYLKDRDQKDAGLIAFVSPDQADWRFSLVKMEYKFIEDKAGRQKVREEFTPAKRWSFLVGRHENCHTAQSRLAPIVEDDTNYPLFEKIEDAFNIESVTREFFEKYKDLFLRVKDEIDGLLEKDKTIASEFIEKKVDTASFSKKLLGQIVFLYFLQKKGWFGVKRHERWGAGSKRFLRDLFEKKIVGYNNFFNDVLEFLFYDALALDRSHDGHWNEHFKCRIPFLNGGLFDPISEYNWHDTEILLSNNLFSNERITKEGDKGDGILDVFDRYNFTVKEDEPLEKDVAVDPEMLGKVFENLLEVKDRKTSGTYYTPREIVSYMCEQSLINYLKTSTDVNEEKIERLVKGKDLPSEEVLKLEIEKMEDEELNKILEQYEFLNKKDAKDLDEALRDIRVVDPACGSGAFLVSMLSKIVSTRKYLSIWYLDLGKDFYEMKLETIENSIFGVDIDLGAVEIAKLRLWLSLIVDEEDIRQIKPLPNLDYKIMQGNSLLEEFEGLKLVDDNLFSNNNSTFSVVALLKEKQGVLQKEYLNLLSQGTKNERFSELHKELKELGKQIVLIKKSLKNENYQGSLISSQDNVIKKSWELKKLHRKYFETNQKGEKKTLRTQIEKLVWEFVEESLKEQNRISAIKKIEEFKRSNTKPFFLWKLNFADVFEEKGGFDVVIANPPYIDSESMVKNGQSEMRESIQKTYNWTKGNWDIYIAFFELGFKSLNKKGSLSFITPDKWISKPFGNEFRKETLYNIYLILRTGRNIFEDAKVDSIVSFFAKQKTDDIKILDLKDGNFVLIREVDKKSLLAPYTFDSLFSKSLDFLLKIEKSNKKLSDFCKCENACATSDAYKLAPLIHNLGKESFNPKEELKIINTGTIGRFYSKWGIREMVYLKHKYLSPIVNKEKFLHLFPNSYGFKSQRPKIIIKGLNLLDGCLDESGTTIPGKTTLIITDDNIKKLKFLLSIITSKLSFFYVKQKYPASSYNQGTSFTKDMINNLPIPDFTKKDENEVIKIYEKISMISCSGDYQKNLEKQSKVGKLEHQIDELVYKLYNLTPEEIKVIENAKEEK